MNARYSKTEAGRAELRARALPLSRTARNLLFTIDGTRPVEEWLGMVQGASTADLESLVSHGLVESAAAAAAAKAAASPPKGATSVDVLVNAMNALNYDALYDVLTHQAKERLGLIAGYRFVLDVEKCADLAEMQAAGRRFIQLLHAEHGEAGLRHLRQALGIQG